MPHLNARYLIKYFNNYFGKYVLHIYIIHIPVLKYFALFDKYVTYNGKFFCLFLDVHRSFLSNVFCVIAKNRYNVSNI